jgi:hypothetical protein
VNGRAAAPLVLLGDQWPAYLDAHRHPELVLPHLFEHVQTAGTAEEAARLVLAGIPTP